MTDGEFLKSLTSQWFHPSQVVSGGVLWNPGDEVLTWDKVVRQYQWYKWLGEWLQPKAFLEVGVGYGYSTLSLLSGLAETPKLIGWIEDESQWRYGVRHAVQAISDLDKNAHIHWGKSWEEFAKMFMSGDFFDLIHIDANHEHEHVTRDAFESYNYAQKGAHWLFHDSDDPPVARAAEEFAEWNKLKWFKIPQVRCGLHVVHSCEEGKCPIINGMAEMNG